MPQDNEKIVKLYAQLKDTSSLLLLLTPQQNWIFHKNNFTTFY